MQADHLSPFGTYRPGGIMRRLLALTRGCSASWPGRRAALYLRAIGVALLRGGPVDIEERGARLRLYPQRNSCEKRILFTPQYFDVEDIAILKQAIGPRFVFVDIGANIGAYSLFVAAAAPADARIVAIEPQPELFARLSCNAAQSGFGSVLPLGCAVAELSGEITLYIDRRNRGASSVHPALAVRGATPLRVPARTLLDIVTEQGFDHIDAVKIDVEGAEDQVLAPFLNEAPEKLWPRLLVMESGHGQWRHDLPALLAERGYGLLRNTPSNLIYCRS